MALMRPLICEEVAETLVSTNCERRATNRRCCLRDARWGLTRCGGQNDIASPADHMVGDLTEPSYGLAIRMTMCAYLRANRMSCLSNRGPRSVVYR